jgi:hypothetical protein
MTPPPTGGAAWRPGETLLRIRARTQAEGHLPRAAVQVWRCGGWAASARPPDLAVYWTRRA